MKIAYILILILFFTQSVSSQESLYKLKTRKTGEWSPDPKPNPNTPKTKIVNQITKDKSLYTIYMKEYVNGQALMDHYSMIDMCSGDKGGRIYWEIDPDTTSAHHLKIFALFPNGSISTRERFCDKDRYFNFKYFKYSKDVIYDKDVPLLFIYEDDLIERKNELFIKEYLKNDIVINTHKSVFPFSKFHRYILIYYRITTNK